MKFILIVKYILAIEYCQLHIALFTFPLVISKKGPWVRKKFKNLQKKFAPFKIETNSEFWQQTLNSKKSQLRWYRVKCFEGKIVMSDGAKAGNPRKPEEDQVEDMAVDEDKTGNSGEEPRAQHLRVNTMEEAPLVRVGGRKARRIGDFHF